MTLKQRRRHGELMGEMDAFRRNPHAKVPDGYVFGEDEDEDARYTETRANLKAVIEELHELEVTAREGN